MKEGIRVNSSVQQPIKIRHSRVMKCRSVTLTEQNPQLRVRDHCMMLSRRKKITYGRRDNGIMLQLSPGVKNYC